MKRLLLKWHEFWMTFHGQEMDWCNGLEGNYHRTRFMRHHAAYWRIRNGK